MKRQSDTTESLVYAYGCGEPIAGWTEALAEVERRRALWDRLVEIERAAETAQSQACAAHDLEAGQILAKIAEIGARLKDLDKPEALPLIAERRALWREFWPRLSAWRKAHKDESDKIEHARRTAVVRVRRESDAYWCNYNAVIEDYDRARKGARQFGRRLRKSDPTRDDGCLTVQIQRTRSGLGAAPSEIMDGSVSMLAIGRVHRDLSQHRGDRDRAGRTLVEMRIDRVGNLIRLPIYFHRPLPGDARVKSAQLVWRREGKELKFRLALTVTRPRAELPPRDGSVAIELCYEHAQGGLQVVRGSKMLVLDSDWWQKMDRVERLHSAIDSEDPACASLKKRWMEERDHLRGKMLRRRREYYRLFARRLAMTYGEIRMTMPILAVVAQTERGEECNSLRQRAALHILQQEIKHQAAKHGCRLVASAQVPTNVDVSKIRKIRKATRALLVGARTEAPEAAS